MPEYRAPGTYVEEVDRHTPSIEGAATATTVFLGNVPDCAADARPVLLTSLGDFTRLYPSADDKLVNAATAFFANGGTRLFITPTAQGDWDAALAATMPLSEVMIVAAPGLPQAAAALIAHAEAQSRFAIVDPPASLDLQAIQVFRAQFDTKNAALYYPWVITANGLQAPSGFVAGLYAQNDATRGVHKAPANQIMAGAIALETKLNLAAQDVLNPLGVNCIISFPDRGIRVWGARTMSSDVEWRYVNVRRFTLYLERSIYQGLAWTAFEPNDETLWARIVATVNDFLIACWQDGALTASKPDQAFFVRCDRTTMTQADIDIGRLIVEIGFAPVRPAEFIIIRIALRAAP